MTLDEELVRQVDAEVRRRRTNRSAFVRLALRQALRTAREQELERRHRRGYTRQPVRPGEFDGWEEEQAWGQQ
jgi:metal-responsive CopG/Arc/MetJ family transcriptional regulator